MKWKLTGRYLSSIVLVVVLVIFINLMLVFALLTAQIAFGVPIFQNQKNTPEQFTRDFQQEITTEQGKTVITEKGQKKLADQKAWIQILDEDGKEIYSWGTPSSLKKKYTPVDMVQMYKYQEVDAATTVYVGGQEKNGNKSSYLIGIQNQNLNRLSISYDDRNIFRSINVGMLILFIDILIALLVGYFFSKGLTQPLHVLIDRIKRLTESEFSYSPPPKGLYKSVFYNLNDLSDQLKRSEKERKRLDVMREEWIANISHDIKTPLSSIQGYAEMLKDPEYDFSLTERREYAEIIEEKSLYIKEVMEDLNLSTRLKNNELALNKQKTNVVAMLRRIVIDLLNNPQYADRDITFHTNEEVIILEVDDILFRRAITNLIYNAIVHNDQQVKVMVSIEKKERMTEITIEDNGKGIKKKEIDKIFDRYYRGTNTGSAHKGSGLGMAIARDVINIHGGQITIYSDGEHGTTIKINI